MTLLSTQDDGQDSDDLQALFDSVAATAVPAARPIPAPPVDAAGDSDDLQALFDSVAASVAAPAPAMLCTPAQRGQATR